MSSEISDPRKFPEGVRRRSSRSSEGSDPGKSPELDQPYEEVDGEPAKEAMKERTKQWSVSSSVASMILVLLGVIVCSCFAKEMLPTSSGMVRTPYGTKAKEPSASFELKHDNLLVVGSSTHENSDNDDDDDEDDDPGTLAERRLAKRPRQGRRHPHVNGAAWSGSWIAEPYGSCNKYCEKFGGPMKRREVKCKDFWTGEDSTRCGHRKPDRTSPCSCYLDVCINEDWPEADCMERPQVDTHPDHIPIPLVVPVGCFEKDVFDTAVNDVSPGDQMDSSCTSFGRDSDSPSSSHRCRSGLPFYRQQIKNIMHNKWRRLGKKHASLCATFCFSRGLDIFGLVKLQSDERECRCGVSRWTANAMNVSKPWLLFDPASLAPRGAGAHCPLQVWRYRGAYIAGSLPLSWLTPNEHD